MAPQFVVLALVVIFGARLYVGSAILFSAPDIALWGVESVRSDRCVFLTLAYARTAMAEIRVSSSRPPIVVTVLIVGGTCSSSA